MKKNIITLIALLVMCQYLSAQSYNNDVSQYCERIGSHPSHCHGICELGGSFYGGLMMSSTNGIVAGNNNLAGLDLGCKLTNTWGYTCAPLSFELNAYLDLKFATYISTSDDEEDFVLSDSPTEPSKSNTDYAVQLTVAPAIRYSNVSIDCGPYIAYSAYNNDTEECFTDPAVSGLDYGIRMGLSYHFSKVQLGIHYDMGLSDQDKKFKKNDLIITIGTQF